MFHFGYGYKKISIYLNINKEKKKKTIGFSRAKDTLRDINAFSESYPVPVYKVIYQALF